MEIFSLYQMYLFDMYIISNITESFKQNPSKAINEMEVLYSDIITSLEQQTQIPKDVIQSFENHDTLCPTIFKDEKMISEIRQQLKTIAKDFIKDMNIGEIKIKDILLVGSMANYNWSKFSDFDLHILVDFNDYDGDYLLVKEYFNTQRLLWNEIHNLKLYDFPVELYVQDVKEKLKATGVYSITQNSWNLKPKRQDASFDKTIVKEKVNQLFDQLKKIRKLYKNNDVQSVISQAKKLRDKIYTYRKAGLQKGGESSNENITFKILRRTAYLDYINDFINKAYDKSMTLS